MAHVFKVNADGSLSGGTYTFGATEVPVSEEMAFTGTIANRASSPWNGKNVFVHSGASGDFARIATLSPTIDLSEFRALFVFAPTTAEQSFPYFLFDAPGDGGFRINRTSGGDLVVVAEWNGNNSLNEVNLGTHPSVPTVVEVTADLTNATAANRLQAKTWALGASVPGSFTTSSPFGPADNGTNRDAWSVLTIGDAAGNGNPGFETGWLVISDDPDEDLSALLSSSATLTTATATSITQTTATIGCTTTSATGTLYGVVTTSATAPSAAQVEAGNDHTGSAAVASGSNASLSVGANTIGVTGLTADTTYYSHFVQDEGTAEYSNVLSSTSWQTLATNVGFRITGIQAPDGSGVGSVDPVSVAIWNNDAATHGAAADTVVADASIVSGTLEVAHAGTLTEDVLVDIQYSTGSPAVLRSVRGTATLIDLDE